MTIEILVEKLNAIEQTLSKQNNYLKPVLNFKEACEYMGVSSSFLYKLTSARAIEHFCPNGKMLYFNRLALDAWMQRNPKRTVPTIQNAASTTVGRERA
ncbi:excisionase family DNA binding protein [Pontibacter aydingkolensis]|uniref:Helix-turn-helix domain-containing protein n=1 Tax=Pontibacter aydingkolensis TaxID=1911536 RepID=A0ABS7CQ88_9BACT|nr:helix-turn-helix domain-containing protein [Pontibacter aydingkolensis]MBW7466012.1 helix-turn-helix domain-containing protein [Pontibacter aydingkolensis]